MVGMQGFVSYGGVACLCVYTRGVGLFVYSNPQTGQLQKTRDHGDWNGKRVQGIRYEPGFPNQVFATAP